jgi:hypothetical protein
MSCPLSLKAIPAQLFVKRHQTSIGKDVCKDLLAEMKGRKMESKREEVKERRRKKKSYIILWKEEMIGSDME